MSNVLDFPDYSSRIGAHHLAGIVHAYWQNRGQEVRVWVEAIAVTGLGGSKVNGISERAFYAVKSDTINGKPREATHNEGEHR